MVPCVYRPLQTELLTQTVLPLEMFNSCKYLAKGRLEGPRLLALSDATTMLKQLLKLHGATPSLQSLPAPEAITFRRRPPLPKQCSALLTLVKTSMSLVQAPDRVSYPGRRLVVRLGAKFKRRKFLTFGTLKTPCTLLRAVGSLVRLRRTLLRFSKTELLALMTALLILKTNARTTRVIFPKHPPPPQYSNAQQ